MPRDYISRKQTPEWRANYDKVFPPKPKPPEEEQDTPEPVVEEARRRELAAVFPFCPYLREE